MKKLIILLTIALAGIVYSQTADNPLITTNADGSVTTISIDANNNYITNTTAAPLPPQLVISTITNVVSVVEPIVLTPYQMAGIIQMVQASGINANVPISITNLDRVNLMHNVDGTFTVRITIR
jgi:hypothetical protein